MWKIIIKSIKEKLTFHQVMEMGEDYEELHEYCMEQVFNIEEGGSDDYEFSFPYTYNPDLTIFNENRIMEKYLPKEILDNFAELSFTGYGEELIIIDNQKEQGLIEMCKKKGWGIKRDDSLIDDCINGGYNAGIFDL